jgi:hypothetical protein
MAEEEENYCMYCGHPLKKDKLKTVLKVIILVLTIILTNTIVWQYQEGQIISLKNDVKNLQQVVNQLSNELNKYKLIDFSSIEELKAFLREDHIDEKEWIEGKYVCINFANDLKIHAAEKGYNISVVFANYEIDRERYGHSFNAALIKNKLIFIEPQNDNIYYSMEELIAESMSYNSIYGIYRKVYPNEVHIQEYAIIW